MIGQSIRRGHVIRAIALFSLVAVASSCKKKDAREAGGSEAKPLVIGITTDASGQYAASGESERRGIVMAIQEFNAKGGVLGRPIKWVHLDTETTPATGARVAERVIKKEKGGVLLGARSSGGAEA